MYELSLVRSVLFVCTSPLLLLWGNVLCAATTYRLSPSRVASGPLFGFLFSFVFIAYPGNCVSSVLALGRAPTAFANPNMWGAYLVSFLAINFCPLDVLFKVCKQRHVNMLLNFLSTLDRFVAALNVMMLCSHSLAQGMFAGLLVLWGGAGLSILRGERSLESTAPTVYYYLLSLFTFYFFAIRSCAPHVDHAEFSRACVNQSLWLEGVAIMGALRAAVPSLQAVLTKVVGFGLEAVKALSNALGFVYWPELHSSHTTGDKKSR